MVEDEQSSGADVLQQLKAVQRALDKINALVLQSNLRSCVTTAALIGDVAHTADELIEALTYRS